MTKKERALFAVEALKNDYPDALCSLQYKEPYQLLIAVRLSAQCTDARVNLVAPVLFEKYPTMESLAEADVADVADIIRSCGFYQTKAKDIVGICQMLLADFGKTVPDTIEELLRLPGVGRKTANLIVGDVYGKPSIVTDTHCIRISNRLGLCSTTDPAKVEIALRPLLPKAESGDFCHRLVLHGRAVCRARNPICDICSLKEVCATYQKGQKAAKALAGKGAK